MALTKVHYRMIAGSAINVMDYGAVGDGVTDDTVAIRAAITASDLAYFNGKPYVVYFPPCQGNNGRYMVSETLVITRNGTCWTGDTAVRRSQPTAIAMLGSATDTTLINITAEAPNFSNLSFEGNTSDDKLVKIFDIHPNPRLPYASEVAALGLDPSTLYNFEDVDIEFNNCNFQFSDSALHTYGRGFYVDTCEFFAVTTAITLDRESAYQEGQFSDQKQATGLRGYAIRNNRFHGMGASSFVIKNVGSNKQYVNGVLFTGNYIDTTCSVIRGPLNSSTFSGNNHIAINNIVFDAITNDSAGDGRGAYTNLTITGNTFNGTSTASSATHFLSTTSGYTVSNVTLSGNSIRNVFNHVVNIAGNIENLVVNSNVFADVLGANASGGPALILNMQTSGTIKGFSFTGNSILTASSYAGNSHLIGKNASSVLTGYSLEGNAFDTSEFVITNMSSSPWASADNSPSVIGRTFCETNTAAVTITDLDDGVTGQEILVLSKGAITFDVTGTNLNGGSTNIVTATGDVTKWICTDGTNWSLLMVMDNSANNSP